jgi:fluoride ion exporter CrcB/FEX
MPEDAHTLWAGAAAGASVPLLYLSWTPLMGPLMLVGLVLGAAVARFSRAQLAQLQSGTPARQGFLQGAVAGSLAGLSTWSVFSLLYWMVQLRSGR